MLNFVPIPDTNLTVSSSGDSRGRILIFKTQNGDDDGPWEHVDGAQIIIIGKEAKIQLQMLLQRFGRPAVNKMIPGGIAGRAYPALRKHLKLTK